MTPNNNDRPSFSSAFSPSQTNTRPSSSSPVLNIPSAFGIPTFTSKTPPATGSGFSSPTPIFNFFPFSSSSTSFPSARSQVQNPRTQSGSRLRVLNDQSSETTTSNIPDLQTDSPAAKNVPFTDESGLRRSDMSPNLDVSTYRDFYHITAIPQLDSDNHAPQTNMSNTGPLPPLHLGSVTQELHNLVAQSVETSSAGSEEFKTADIDSDSGSDENDVCNYKDDVQEEELPPAPIYNVRLQQSLREVRGHLSSLAVSMERSASVHDEASDIDALYKQVESASKFEYPETRIVGFIGDLGVGKSSLINSLLDHEGLARSSGNGEACTSVVTEFRRTDETHPHPFTIEVDFMNTDELRELLQEAFDEVTEQKESERTTALARRAFATLNLLFPKEPDMTEEFLSNEAPHAEEMILRQALHQIIEARDIYECRENIDMLTVASQPGKPALWPFVKLLGLYLNCPILRTGLVVADLPGFRDLNYVRVRATERYLRHVCDEAFVVSDICRCRTDPSIKEILEKRLRGQPIGIVCTLSESQLNAEESIREPGTPTDARIQIKQLIDRIEQAQRSFATTRIRRRRSSGAHQGQLAMQEADARLKTLLIETRNRLVAADMSRKYQPDVKIFCVSSKLYSDHRGDYKERNAEYIRLSGIPELRRYCQSIPAEAQLRATSAFLKNRVPAILGSLNQWVLAASNSVTVERAATVRLVLDNARKILETRLTSRNSCIQSANQILLQSFKTPLLAAFVSDSEEKWKAGAIGVSQDWRTLHHSTYATFCRKYGIHRPLNGRLRCWNNEILQEASEELDQAWSSLLVWLTDEKIALHELIDEIINSVSACIEEHANAAPEVLDNFLENLEVRKHCIADIVERSFEDVPANSTRIHRDALDGHSSTSYIADIMRSAYSVCNAESGGGSDARRKNHMDEHVRHSRIFPRLSQSIQADYKAMTDSAFTELRRKIADDVQNISRDLGGIIAVDGEVTEAGREPDLAQRVRSAIMELGDRLNEAHTVLDQVRNVP
ncbi:hypothetical protein BDV09DRAFT_202801 [Aspergillus tetrazonus]